MSWSVPQLHPSAPLLDIASDADTSIVIESTNRISTPDSPISSKDSREETIERLGLVSRPIRKIAVRDMQVEPSVARNSKARNTSATIEYGTRIGITMSRRDSRDGVRERLGLVSRPVMTVPKDNTQRRRQSPDGDVQLEPSARNEHLTPREVIFVKKSGTELRDADLKRLATEKERQTISKTIKMVKELGLSRLE